MTRTLTTPVKNQLTASTNRPALLFDLFFEQATIRLWTGYGTLVWGTDVYFGNGWLTSVSNYSETGDIRPEGMTITLTGIPLEVTSLILSSAKQSDTCNVWFAVLNEAFVLINDPFKLFRGRFDLAEIKEGPDTTTIAINYESRLVALDKPKIRRYTQADQAAQYPDDKGFEHVIKIPEWTGFWGKQNSGQVK